MSAFPDGTVTFVFTDVEGSTRLLQELGDGYAEVARDHRRILREALGDAGGTEIDNQGDSFFFSFTRARDAARGAVDAQRALRDHTWPHGAELRVRMGLHTGEPSVGDEGYLGLDVVRAARISAAGHGGQILVSETTRALLGNALPEGVTVHDHGEAELKDIQHERIYELSIDGDASSFPPLKTHTPKSAGEAFAERIQRQVERNLEHAFREDATTKMPVRLAVSGLAIAALGLALLAAVVIVGDPGREARLLAEHLAHAAQPRPDQRLRPGRVQRAVERTPGRRLGARHRPAGEKLGELRAGDHVRARDVQRAGLPESRQLEQRGGEVAHVHGVSKLVRVEGHRGILRCQLVPRGLGATVDQRRANDQRVGMRSGHAPLGLCLRAAVVGRRSRLVVLHVGSPLAAVEDDVGREVDEPCAQRLGCARHRLGAGDVDLVRGRPVLAVGGVDHHVRAHTLEQRADGARVPDLHPLGRRSGQLPCELRPEISGRPGDVDTHGCTLSGRHRRLARMRRTFLWINFVLASAIVLLIFLQAYFIASYAMGAGEDALDAHGVVGGLFIHAFELLVFLTAFGAWPRQWKWIGVTFGLFVLGTVQIFLLPPDENPGSPWVHGLHGLLALVVMVYAAFIAHRGMRDLGLRRGHAAGAGGDTAPPLP